MKLEHSIKPVLVVAILPLIGCGDSELFVKPPASPGVALSIEPQQSTIGAQVRVPLPLLQSTLEARVPREHAGRVDPEERPCGQVRVQIPLGIGSVGYRSQRHCVNVWADYTAKRTPIVVEAISSDTLRVSTTIALNGKGNIRGSGTLDRLLIDVLQLRAKNFAASARVVADISFDVTEDWCPRPKAKIAVNWTTTPRVEVAHKVWMTLDTATSTSLRNAIADIERSVAGAIPCDVVQAQVKPLFAKRSIPFDVPSVGQMYATLAPKGAGWSGLSVNAEAVSLATQLQFEGLVSVSPAASAPVALPPLRRIPNEPPRTRLAVPVKVPYSALAHEATRNLAGKTFQLDTPAGKATVTVKSATVYPAAERVAVGINAAVDVPGRWFDVKGDIFVLGTPEARGTVVELQNVRFAQVLDNQTWDFVSATLRERIISEIQKAARYDLKADLEKTLPSMEQVVTKLAAESGVALRPTKPSFGLGRVAVAKDTLEVEAIFEATLDATFAKLPSPQ